MRSIRSLRVPTLALALASLAVASILVQRLRNGTEVTELLATPAQEFSMPEVAFEVPETAVADLQVIRDRALFYATRTFYTAPAPSAMRARPDYRLAGVFVVPREPGIALLIQNTTGASRKVRQGEELDGWLVQTVEAKRVVLQYEGESMEIVSTSASANDGLISAPLPHRARAAAASAQQ
jgi:hypothetical protein